MNLPDNTILTLIPQRPPFVMIDRLLYCDETTARTGLTVKVDNLFVEDGVLTAPGLTENIAQTAAARSGFSASQQDLPAPVGFIGGIKNLRIHALPKTGNELVTEITIVNQIFDVMMITGRVLCGDELLAECEMKIFINPIK
ncbi:MAG: 3-hydroxyacyl-ACP dehydratase [Chitinophagaceae bacterium]|nr:3-hydroxyacyl-ACP dehydratase [Chitinophagaceae bacterium]